MSTADDGKFILKTGDKSEMRLGGKTQETICNNGPLQ